MESPCLCIFTFLLFALAGTCLGENDANGSVAQDMYFFENDLHPGRKFEALQFEKTTILSDNTTFLPAEIAKKMPFSSDKFLEILKYFSLKEDSVEANLMKETIEFCERLGIGREDKFCVTTLESMVDMTNSKLGQEVQVLSSVVEKETKIKEFTVLEGAKDVGEKKLACHKMKYPYAVFYCHSVVKTTSIYGVPMVGSDGTKAVAIAFCHKNTSSWDPSHLAFKLLKVKPGSGSICHFHFEEILVLYPKNN